MTCRIGRFPSTDCEWTLAGRRGSRCRTQPRGFTRQPAACGGSAGSITTNPTLRSIAGSNFHVKILDVNLYAVYLHIEAKSPVRAALRFCPTGDQPERQGTAPNNGNRRTAKWRSNDERRANRRDMRNPRNRGAGRAVPVLVPWRKRGGRRRRNHHVRRFGLRNRSPRERDTRVAPALLPRCGCSSARHAGAGHAKRRETSPVRGGPDCDLAPAVRTPRSATGA